MNRIIMIQLQIICFLSSLFVIANVANADFSIDEYINSYSFNVKIGDYDITNIISVEGLGIEMSLVENESKNSQLIELSPGSVKIKQLTLKKRFIPNSFFNNWAEKALAGKSDQYLKNIIITLLGY